MLAKLNGRLLPFGWLKALRARKKIDAVRVFALGVKPSYQNTGVAARFYQMHFDAAEQRALPRNLKWGAREMSKAAHLRWAKPST